MNDQWLLVSAAVLMVLAMAMIAQPLQARAQFRRRTGAAGTQAMVLSTTDEQLAEAEAQAMVLPATDEKPADTVISARTQRSRTRSTVLGIVGYWSTLRSRLEGLAQAAQGTEGPVAAPADEVGLTGLLPLAIGAFAFVATRDFWLGDDSFITLRVVYNFVYGFGLRWNIDERVQVYTHPLWMFVLAAVFFLLRNSAFTTLLVALPLSIAAVALFAQRLAGSPARAVVGIAALTASKSYVDYSASGLENPLSFLLLVVFLAIYYRRGGKRHLFWLSFVAGLAVLNRMDLVLLYLPALAVCFFAAPREGRVRQILAGFAPFLLWELFSLWYYGFLFPNTAYAKLTTGLPAGDLFYQGLTYFLKSGQFDPLLFIMIVAGFFAVLQSRDWQHVPLLVGVALYLLYVAKIGGDFMAGRFLTEPYLLSVVLAVRALPGASMKAAWPYATALVLATGILTPNSRIYPVTTVAVTSVDSSGVIDERAWWVSGTGIAVLQRGVYFPCSAPPPPPAAMTFVTERVIGQSGCSAGPYVHVVDPLALGDPLLARLPAIPAPNWRIGHFERAVPDGYMDTLQTGQNHFADPQLGLYYQKLSILTRGSLFDPSRLVEIVKFNLGMYNYLLPPQ